MSKLFNEIIQKLHDIKEESTKEAHLAQSKRNELLKVATQLAAGMNTIAESNYLPEHFEDFNTLAIYQAKDLIEKVDKECGE